MSRIGRTWLCNMLNTVIGARFNMWVSECVKQRNEKIAADRNLDLELDPHVAKLFQNSTSVSSKY